MSFSVKSFKIVLIGDIGVGKTSFFLKYCDDIGVETPQPPTVNDEIRHKTIHVMNTKQQKVSAKLQICDTAGQESYGGLTSGSYRGAEGVLLCYDITDRSSFNRIPFWKGDIEKHAPNVVACVVGLKGDMDIRRQVSTIEGMGLAQTWNAPFFEVSAKTNSNLAEAVQELARKLVIAQPSGSTMRRDPSKKKVTAKKKTCTIL